jgi:hypothetical protein
MSSLDPPSASRSRRRPTVFMAVAIVGAAIGLAACSSGTSSSSSTTKPPTTTTTQPKLISVMPSAFAAQCTNETSSDFIDTNQTAQVVCSGSNVPDADVLIYEQYDNTQDTDNYYSATLLTANTMQSAQGDCTSATLSGSTPNGTYCETNVTSNGKPVGNVFLFNGTEFNIGSGVSLASVLSSPPPICANTNAGFGVVGWTVDSSNLVALAITCSNDIATLQNINKDYLANSFDLAS